jgi:polyhydroxyalkanoate synthesis regulator phasin
MILTVLSGCAALGSGEIDIMQRYPQAQNLAAANSLLESGDTAAAARTFSGIIDAGSYPGITDEALFNLALLELRPAAEQDGNARALQLLKQLGKEYPASSWTARSRHLLELLTGVEELRRQVRSLKGSNQALTKEVDELNRNIDQLKKLDQDLEKMRR